MKTSTAATLMLLLSVAGPVRGETDPPTPIDPRASLEAAELAFAAAAKNRDPVAFRAALADDAVFVSGDNVTRGADAVVAAWMPLLTEGGPLLEWHPEIVELAEGGQLGLSRGPWTMTVLRPDGTKAVRSGTFNSTWRRQPDNSWRVIFDAGCDNGGP